MKCKELMVGDLVADSRGLPMVITNVDNDYAYAHNYRDFWKGCEFDNDDEPPIPIPVTPEILEKNGWCLNPILKCYSDVPSWLYEEDETNLVLQFSTKQYGGLLNIFDERRIRNLSNFIWKNTLYVHELQHVLRLCGLNKLADNFKI